MTGAEFFSVEPQPTRPARDRQGASMGTCFRQTHRWVSVAFTLTVAANFTAMILGQPPTWITYSPLPPLLILLVTGLYMLGRHLISTWS
jgi:hypothetical protein